MGPRSLALLAAGTAVFATSLSGEVPVKKPRLVLRATPPAAIGPVEVLVTAVLVGGDEHEDFYCPQIEWTWADDSRSVREEDCPAYEARTSTIARRYTARRVFEGEGPQWVRLTLRRGSRVVAESATSVMLTNPRAGY
jgi:hypothetical protein